MANDPQPFAGKTHLAPQGRHYRECRIFHPIEDPGTADLHPLSKKILALLPDHETLTLGQLVHFTCGKPSTLKLRLKELVADGYLLP